MNKKQFFALLLAGVLTTTSCGTKTNIKLYEDYFNRYKNYTKRDSNVDKYKKNNILIAINKETKEVNEYIYYIGKIENPKDKLLSSLGYIVEIYDLKTGKLIYFNSKNRIDYNIGIENLNKLTKENNLYTLNEQYEFEHKEWYTIKEINEITESIKSKEQTKTLIKIK